MLQPSIARWPVRLATLGVWALAAASAAYWGLKLGGQGATAPLAPIAPRGFEPADPQAVAKLLGANPFANLLPAAAPAAPPLSSRFALVGVVASRSNQGAALISVDGKPARPYRVGAFVDEGLVLQAVEGRRALIGASVKGPASVTLELPPLRKAP